MAMMNCDQQKDQIEYEPIRRAVEQRAWRAVRVGLVGFVGHVIMGVLYWPAKSLIDHQGPTWASITTDWLFPALLPLPFATLSLGMNQGMHGQDEYRMLVWLSLVNSAVYGALATWAYLWLQKRWRRRCLT